jgi:uncharacterized protein YggE
VPNTSEEDSGVNKSKYHTVSYRVRAGAPPSCHRKEVRLALAIELTKYSIVNSIQVRIKSTLHFGLAIALSKSHGLTYGREVHLAKREPN